MGSVHCERSSMSTQTAFTVGLIEHRIKRVSAAACSPNTLHESLKVLQAVFQKLTPSKSGNRGAGTHLREKHTRAMDRVTETPEGIRSSDCWQQVRSGQNNSHSRG